MKTYRLTLRRVVIVTDVLVEAESKFALTALLNKEEDALLDLVQEGNIHSDVTRVARIEEVR